MATPAQPPCFTFDAPHARVTLTVHVQPGARTSAVAGVHGDALKIRIAAPAVDNKANDALIAFLAETLSTPAAHVRLRRGGTSRRKVIEIGAAGEALVERLRILTQALPR